MVDCWNDGVAGFVSNQGIDEMDGLMVGIMDVKVADCRDEWWAGELAGLMAGCLVRWLAVWRNDSLSRWLVGWMHHELVSWLAYELV